MTDRVLSSALKEHVGKTVKIAGWLHKQRALGGMTFILVRDRHGLIQVLIDKKDEQKKLDGLQVGTVLTITGEVVADQRAQAGAEIHNPEITIDVPVMFVSPIEIDKPIDHTPENLDTLFDNRIVSLRNLTEQGIFKIQSEVKNSVREFLRSQDFIEFNSPKLLAGSTEGGAEVFRLDYFGKEATLAQSAQFYKQIMVGVFERAFEINPTYRAEPSMTTRHMTEFIHVDAEMGFVNSLSDVLDLLSGLINHVSQSVWDRQEKELTLLGANKPMLLKKIPEITMKELHDIYSKDTGENTRGERDLTPSEERWVYHKRSEVNPEVADRADLIFRGVEMATTSLRENRYDVLLAQMKEKNLDPENPGFKYYLQAFKYGLPLHGGFGLGLERLTQKIIGLKNVKEATLFPRDTNRLAP